MGTYNKNIVFFDGVCRLCYGFINWISKKDRYGRLFYAPLQGHTAKRMNLILPKYATYQTIFFLTKEGRIYSKSSAVLLALSYLNFPFSLFKYLLIIPSYIRDRVYMFIANRRYQWFGKRHSCRIATLDKHSQFLD